MSLDTSDAAARPPEWTRSSAPNAPTYFNRVLGRAGIWSNGTGARSRVHYGNAHNNAFWDGTQMTYGEARAMPSR